MLHVTAETRAKIEVWQHAKRGIDLQRDDLIRQAKAEHGSLREIGLLFDLSHTEVARILNQETRVHAS
jgi:hypothetical protein